MKKIEMLKDEIVVTAKGPVRLFAGEKHRLDDTIAQSLVGRGFAKYDEPEKKGEKVEPALAKSKSQPRKRVAKPKVKSTDEGAKEA